MVVSQSGVYYTKQVSCHLPSCYWNKNPKRRLGSKSIAVMSSVSSVDQDLKSSLELVQKPSELNKGKAFEINTRGQLSIKENPEESVAQDSTPVIAGKEPMQSSIEMILPRRRGRPKGAKNKNPKPKPPPKPRRPIGRPRKQAPLMTRFTRQHPYTKLEPVSDEPPDEIFEDDEKG